MSCSAAACRDGMRTILLLWQRRCHGAAAYLESMPFLVEFLDGSAAAVTLLRPRLFAPRVSTLSSRLL
jgi:hypothetical protein